MTYKNTHLNNCKVISFHRKTSKIATEFNHNSEIRTTEAAEQKGRETGASFILWNVARRSVVELLP